MFEELFCTLREWNNWQITIKSVCPPGSIFNPLWSFCLFTWSSCFGGEFQNHLELMFYNKFKRNGTDKREVERCDGSMRGMEL